MLPGMYRWARRPGLGFLGRTDALWRFPGRTDALRRTARALAAGGLALATLAGCGLVGATTAFQRTFTVTSPVVSGSVIPARYTCHGAGQSPPLHWSGAPAGTKSLALVVDDSDAPITPYVYWIVLGINPATTDIQSGELPPGAHQAMNSAGQAAYDPPCPDNHAHWYRFTVYALDSSVSLPSGTSLKSAWTAIARTAIARGRLPVIAEP
jgi:hypothetical protein